MKKEDLELGETYLNITDSVTSVIDKVDRGCVLTISCGSKSITFNTATSVEKINEENDKVVKQVLGILGEYQDNFTNLFNEL